MPSGVVQSVETDWIALLPDAFGGASAIQCCYAATERRESSTLTDTGESKNANVTLRSANKSIVDEKISLNVSRLVTSPACMAGVLSSRPNFKIPFLLQTGTSCTGECSRYHESAERSVGREFYPDFPGSVPQSGTPWIAKLRAR